MVLDREKYRKELEEAEADLSHKLGMRRRLDARIARLRLDISALAQLCGEPLMTTGRLGMSATVGLSDACREVLLAHSPELLTPAEVVEGLKALGFPTDQTNVLASVATTLRRMHSNRELEMKRDEEGGKRRFGFRDIVL